ncbi:5-formyltetrahydrofolate cyclo-ligase [Cellulomonas chengniuliangii]|uniref:5-formyltetrahydrofolate cyclo-ligase n=1 Tax=Cellulomonas chengniuliangii TaxID=2968084 RepID=A0ABY5L2A8_9CELL|nr:5-formyltetrahydrofolate cyclo-ligase [Cellulomonas chengniuliangii]MCC2307166.1 5-formyltetrahydrofolate cyclo-ligase [Cellulomonas chengniuliangii]MCC2317937.1 5-formyltetrahydrofolate cyclo-ligase [Cellulomonas chengniuliangii]UUI76038.1 5-formyltetrahydrofolate cyclo-ligase [Cellulomonas chengniuliangii]
MRSAAQPYPPASDGLEVEDLKDYLRRSIRAARAARSPRRREEAAAALASVVDTVPEVAEARCVSVYAARSTEPGTGPLLERLAARGVRVLLPVLGAGLQRDWAEYAGAEDLRQRAPGRPPEPSTPALGPEAIADADVIVAPALAIDTAGTRLGQGGGWYDRALLHARPGVRVIGLVFPEEVYDAGTRPLPRQPHDRTVDTVATPGGWRSLRPGDARAG